MREVIAEIENWQKAGKPVGIATNVKRNGMSLRPLGAKMAMTDQMDIAGSVTGGCIEGTVYDEAQKVIRSHQPCLLHYGVTGDEKPWDIGLSCGTSLDVFVEDLNSAAWKALFPAVQEAFQKNQLAAVATVICGAGLGNKMMVYPDGRCLGDLGNTELNEEAKTWMRELFITQEINWKEFTVAGESVEVFIDLLIPVARMIVIGAVHIAIPLVEMAKVMGFHTIVVDPREAFANRDRLPKVDELIVDWPSTVLDKLNLDESSYVVAISHDEKLDNPALAVALTHSTRYVGVLGTRKNVPQRLAALRELGVNEEQLQKLRAPIGLPLGAETPEEIALSILAEMISARHGLPRI
jgi:xanthine dehydrogenase accessory factor